MARSITVTDTSTPASGQTITGRSYRLLAADGTTVLSTANPPYAGVTDALVKLEQTVTQSDAQTAVVTRDIPGRVTDLAASNAAAPVLTWTDIGGETSYEIHRGAAGFTPDVAGGTTKVGTAAAGAATATDSTVSGNGSTVYAYRVVAKTAYGWTIGNEATCTPASSSLPNLFQSPTDLTNTTYWTPTASVASVANVAGIVKHDGSTGTVARVTSDTPSPTNGGGGGGGIQQLVSPSGGTAGKTFTITCWARAVSTAGNMQLKLTQQGVVDHFSTDQALTTTWQFYTFTFTMGGTAAAQLAAGFFRGTGSGAGFQYYLDEVKVVNG